MPYLPTEATLMLDLSRLSCLGEALRDAVLTYKSNVALIEVDRHRENARYGYRELRGEAERVAGVLQAGGLAARRSLRDPDVEPVEVGHRAASARSGRARCSCRSTTS